MVERWKYEGDKTFEDFLPHHFREHAKQAPTLFGRPTGLAFSEFDPCLLCFNIDNIDIIGYELGLSAVTGGRSGPRQVDRFGSGYILKVDYQFRTKEPYARREFTTYLLISNREELLRRKYENDIRLKQGKLTGVDLSAVLGFNQDIFGPKLFLEEPHKAVVLPESKFPSFNAPFLTVPPERLKYVEHDFAIPIRAAVWLPNEVAHKLGPLVAQLQCHEQTIEDREAINKGYELQEAENELTQLKTIITSNMLSYSIDHIRNKFGIDLSEYLEI